MGFNSAFKGLRPVLNVKDAHGLFFCVFISPDQGVHSDDTGKTAMVDNRLPFSPDVFCMSFCTRRYLQPCRVL